MTISSDTGVSVSKCLNTERDSGRSDGGMSLVDPAASTYDAENPVNFIVRPS